MSRGEGQRFQIAVIVTLKIKARRTQQYVHPEQTADAIARQIDGTETKIVIFQVSAYLLRIDRILAPIRNKKRPRSVAFSKSKNNYQRQCRYATFLRRSSTRHPRFGSILTQASRLNLSIFPFKSRLSRGWLRSREPTDTNTGDRRRGIGHIILDRQPPAHGLKNDSNPCSFNDSSKRISIFP